MRKAIVPALLSLVLGVGGGALGAGAVLWARPTLQAQPAFATPTEPPVVRSVSPQGEIIADLVEQVGSAVVNIDTVTNRKVYYHNPFMGFDEFFGFPQNHPPVQGGTIKQKGQGSGFVIDPSGLIVTNFHVVRKADELTVTFPDGKKLKGKVVGRDPATDLALVKVDGKGLPTLKLADPQSIRVGQWVVAIGSPLGLKHSVTAGILSAVNRDVELNNRVGFLQTDAPINPGNSGGPLLNLRGEVIGVNTAVRTDGQGIGFAVPVGTVRKVVPQLQAKGRVERAWIGVGLGQLPEDRSRMFYPESQGALVSQVEPNSPAAKAGLQPGDIILELNGKPVADSQELIRRVADMEVGAKVSLKVNREGQRKTLDLVLDKMPDRLATASGPEE